MPDLRVKFMGLDFSTPFLLASGQFTTSIGQIHKHVKEIASNGWSGLVAKTLISQVYEPAKPYLWSSPAYRLRGMQNSGPPLTKYNSQTLRDMSLDVRASHDYGLVFIASIIGHDLQGWREMPCAVQEAGADAMELNLSCPSERVSIKGSMGGYMVGQNPELVREVVHAVCSQCKIPVMPKLTFHYSDFAHMASVCKNAGASAVSAINTIRGLIGVDIQTGILISSDAQGNGFLSGISGPIIKPFGLRAVAEIAQGTDIPVCGIGGIDNWQSVAEYIMVGATLVQVCTGVMWHGFGLGQRLQEGLQRFMEDKGYAALSQFRGTALRRIVRETIPHGQVCAVIDQDRCTLCKLCVTACKEAAFEALNLIDGRVVVDRQQCQGCGLCEVVCSQEAIGYVED